MWVGLRVMSVAGREPMACSKVVSGPAGVRPNTFGGRNSCLQQSGCGSKLPPQKSWFDNSEESSGGSRADSHLVMRDRFPGGKTCQLCHCESLVKRQWGQTQSVSFCLLEASECVMC